ncbi:MAG: ribosome recycling factor [Paludibacteraceae bacterium]|nr:ribosome recycling factor [Paludibacteraceae bacterium]
MDEKVKSFIDSASEDMEATIMYLDDTLAHIRAGKASVRILDGIMVDYYGAMTPLDQVSNITVPDARTIQIQPWEKKMLTTIERALQNSNIGITPANNGEVVRLCFPPVTEERRKELVKQSNSAGEEAKVSIRNTRRDIIDKLKKEVKNGMPEDVEKDGEAEAQKIHDTYIRKIEELLDAKEKEIMTI